MPGLVVALCAGGLAVVAVALIAAMALANLRTNRGWKAPSNPELKRASDEIRSQIDRGRGGFG